MKNKKILLIVGLGAIGLYAFYRYRKGLPIVPGWGSTLAGQGTNGSPLPNNSFRGSTTLPSVPPQPMSESERIRLRNLATGDRSRGSCIFPGCRWIDTQTPPYFGLKVDQATFTRWMSGGFTYPGSDVNAPTDEFVRRALGI